ncbi:4-hydroxybenzoate 3-monooxygenase [Acuticoccus kandeliae]|uniref:4-hydroxybenzoate 3-monooxygenase n=1 Tax=Acuticoccus kandeliae TaxID=2073160 RepID=UPI000D3EBBE4|nr:4-hydroxybenzoate 3-monooxygenase [Acuticoccus kandeliae]
MRTQVAIIGGGPSGLLLSQILMRHGIETVVLERHTREHVLSRIRAGVLEWGSVEMLRAAGIGARMDAEGEIHRGVAIGDDNRQFRIDFDTLVGKAVMIYGQTEITKDLYAAQDALGATIVTEAADVALADLDAGAATVTYRKDGREHGLVADFVIGCDGFHGVSRPTIPAGRRQEYEVVFPFSWLGVLSETPPVADELIYASHPRGFALASMRNRHLSRYYLQIPNGEPIEAWPDTLFWDELRRRLPADAAGRLVTGPSIEKSIAPLRSFVCEPMRYGRLLLVGDAAHIVPPTGAKGLNLAISDVHYASEALIAHFRHRDDRLLEEYSDTTLKRVWKAMRFSWWMTNTVHRFADHDPFQQMMQKTEIDYLEGSIAAKTALAENYTGLPY